MIVKKMKLMTMILMMMMTTTMQKPLSNGGSQGRSHLGRTAQHHARVGEEEERQGLVGYPGYHDQNAADYHDGDHHHNDQNAADYHNGDHLDQNRSTS